MDGLIVLNKPLGLTSARALDQVRRITGIRKSGHAGTLDPLATGVLLVCLGRGTKLVERLMTQPKVYRVTARLDITSASYDLECPTTPVEAAPPSLSQLTEALAGFEGQIEQVPPLSSALKIGGRPAYRFHRRGQQLDLPARPVTIYWFALESYAFPALTFAVACGRGMYVRSLVRDLGQRLGTGGCLTALERTAIGPFKIEAAATPDQLAATEWRTSVIPVDQVLQMTAQQEVPARPPTCAPIPPHPQT